MEDGVAESIERRVNKLEHEASVKNFRALFDALKRVESLQRDQEYRIDILERKVLAIDDALNNRFNTVMQIIAAKGK